MGISHPFPAQVALAPGDVVSLYVHSQLQSDTGVVYDNARGGAASEDTYLRVGAGCAHLSPVPFAGKRHNADPGGRASPEPDARRDAEVQRYLAADYALYRAANAALDRQLPRRR